MDRGGITQPNDAQGGDVHSGRYFLHGRAGGWRSHLVRVAAGMEDRFGHPRIWSWAARAVAATCVHGSGRFLLREITGRPGISTYRLRAGDARICVRHRTTDTLVVTDIFARGEYSSPPEVRDRLAHSSGTHLKVLDMGGHIGMFALSMLGAGAPGSVKVTSMEPDPGNAEVLRDCIDANGLAGDWQLVEAAAGREDGTTEFLWGHGWGSRIPSAADRGPMITVPVRDMFDLLGTGVDLLKLDIEGGEWEIVGDPRMRDLPVPVIAFEYHDTRCPGGGTARTTAETSLTNAGYRIVETMGTAAKGIVWAIR